MPIGHRLKIKKYESPSDSYSDVKIFLDKNNVDNKISNLFASDELKDKILNWETTLPFFLNCEMKRLLRLQKRTIIKFLKKNTRKRTYHHIYKIGDFIGKTKLYESWNIIQEYLIDYVCNQKPPFKMQISTVLELPSAYAYDFDPNNVNDIWIYYSEEEIV